MLCCMQQSAQSEPSPRSQSFAGLLAALAKPARDDSLREPEWNEADLGADVVTLSYDRALRAHARYKPAYPVDLPAPQPEQVQQCGSQETTALVEGLAEKNVAAKASARRDADLYGDLRTASVTIRLSKTECAQLHQRAAEAGVTVSSYMRSCTFEADALRAEVKAALAELRLNANKGKPAALKSSRRSMV